MRRAVGVDAATLVPESTFPPLPNRCELRATVGVGTGEHLPLYGEPSSESR